MSDRNHTFHVDDGEIVGLVGPNGAGKTTAMRIVLGLLEAETGEVRRHGRTLTVEDLSWADTRPIGLTWGDPVA